MNTKILMSASAVFMAIFGISTIFLPQEILKFLEISPSLLPLLMIQFLGALYFGFSMINWMSREAIIGGIYNRPIAIGNFAHFFIAGIALIKDLFIHPGSNIIWIISVPYVAFAGWFGLVLFTHPHKA